MTVQFLWIIIVATAGGFFSWLTGELLGELWCWWFGVDKGPDGD